MAAGDAGPARDDATDPSLRDDGGRVTVKQGLAMMETAGADERPAADPSAPPMAVSIAGISTACSKNALVTSARAVARSLTPE